MSIIFWIKHDYPSAPRKLEIKREILSDYQLKVADDYNISIGNDEKLISKFFKKENHVRHCKNLQLYVRLGIKIKKYAMHYNIIDENG